MQKRKLLITIATLTVIFSIFIFQNANCIPNQTKMATSSAIKNILDKQILLAPPSPPPQVIQLGSGSGSYATFFINPYGKVAASGKNDFGQLGSGAINSPVFTPVNASLFNGAIQISGGYIHSCGLYPNGKVKCVGNNTYFQLGNGTKNDSTQLVEVNGINDAKQISVGYLHSCALLSSKQVKCWGNNSHGELGNTTYNTIDVIPGVNNAIQVSAGSRYFTCVLLSTGQVKCYGVYTTNIRELDPSMISSATQISVARDHVCAILQNKKVQCGNRLGMAQDIDEAIQIVSGEDHSCVLIATGQVKCFNSIQGQQITDYGNFYSAIPSVVSGLSNVVRIAAGAFHTCALIKDGSVKCFGTNQQGPLGDGFALDRTTPVLFKFPSF